MSIGFQGLPGYKHIFGSSDTLSLDIWPEIVSELLKSYAFVIKLSNISENQSISHFRKCWAI